MKTKLLLFIFMPLFSSLLGEEFGMRCFSQNNRLWATYYGGADSDNALSIVTNATGNVYLAGQTWSSVGIASGGFQNIFGGSIDAFLVKFDVVGNRIWSTYYGGAGNDAGISVATDAAGNVYLAGGTSSTSGIASSGFQNVYGGGGDAFLVKFDASGNRLWSTYYGGAGNDRGISVATDAAGNVYLAGETASTTGISSGGFQNTYGGGTSDAFLVKFDVAGNRIWATYYGGVMGYEEGFSVTTDAFGNVYMAGSTNSTSGIASGGFQNIYSGGIYTAFLVKFDTSGNRLWATYYGGTTDVGYSVATDAFGNVYMAGSTNSTSGIASGGFQNTISGGVDDAFLVKFDAVTGIRLWATYYGGTDNDVGYRVTTDASGNIYMSGLTLSTIGIAAGGFQNNLIGSKNAFVVKFDPNGNRLCATYYGQLNEVWGTSALDGLGNVYVAGWTTSVSGISSGGFQNTYGGGSDDAFLVKFTSCLSATITTAINVSCNGQCTGTANVISSGGTSPYTYQWNNGQTTQTATGLCAGNYSVIVTDSSGSTTVAAVTITQPSAITISVNSTQVSCIPVTGTASANPIGGTPAYTYSWSNGQTTKTTTGLNPGSYTVTVTDANNCTSIQSVTIKQILALTSELNNTTCDGFNDGSATVSPIDGVAPYTYSWSNGQTTQTISGLVAGNYAVTVIDVNGCSNTTNFAVNNSTPPELYLPNAFSPNSDGENDVFCLQGSIEPCIKELKIIIYDRWGENVFESNDSAFCWDGKYKGNPMNPAVFVYYLRAILTNQQEVEKKGNVSLIR